MVDARVTIQDWKMPHFMRTRMTTTVRSRLREIRGDGDLAQIKDLALCEKGGTDRPTD